MLPDLDFHEYHVSIRGFADGQPFITPDGQTSLDMPYEACEITDVMFEARAHDLPTARIAFPSLIAFPQLRPLLAQLKEGSRVEIFNFQPDCGDPIFAGEIPPEGITERDGHVTIDLPDTLGKGRWQRVRRIESLNDNARGLYGRCMSRWIDVIAEDFQGPNPAGDYAVTLSSATPAVFGKGFVSFTGPGGGGPAVSAQIVPATQPVPVAILPGDTWLLEADCSLNTALTNGTASAAVSLYLYKSDLSVPRAGGSARFNGPPSPPTDQPQLSTDVEVFRTDGTYYSPFPGHATRATTFPIPWVRRVQVLLAFLPGGSVSMNMYVDNVNVATTVQPWVFDATLYTPLLALQAGGLAGDSATVTSWRVRKLQPWINQAARFVPQTTDNLVYAPNNEELLQFLQLTAERDNAEFRPIYRALPKADELEIDAAGSLGADLSATLGYDQPGAAPTQGSPQSAPVPAAADYATFAVAPPFRFEEGYNLAQAPAILPRSNAHSNDVLRMGSATAESQILAEAFSPSETGRPQHSPSGAQYPYFEQITNDDRVGFQALATTMVKYELGRRTDPTPSMELAVVDELKFTGRVRAGDKALVITRSLRTNVEQTYRIQKRKTVAGSPDALLTVGKAEWDPSMQRMLSEAMTQQWLYEQSGTTASIYVFPGLPATIPAGGASGDFTIPLDKFTTGTQLVYAALHWFTDPNGPLLLQPIINGSGLYLSGAVAASVSDSGLIVCTQYFQAVGNYAMHFSNTDIVTRTVNNAFLVLRLKA